MRTRKATIADTGAQLKGQSNNIVIEKPKTYRVGLEVTGTADLIQNNFSQKSVEQMLRKHMGLSVQREAKKPREVIEHATIKNLDGRVCIPPQAFKGAMLTASAALKTFKKTQLRTALFVVGRSIPITFEEMTPRMDMTRTSGMARTPDVRFRPAFTGWKARMIIEYSDLIQVQSVVDLLNRAGSVGVGEWRPEKNGTFGTFQVTRNIVDSKEIGEVEAECSVALVGLKIPEWALDAEIDPALLSRIMSSQDESETDDEEPKKTNGAAHA